MKKIILLLSVFLVLVSCKKLTDLNKDTKDPMTTSGEDLFTNAQKTFFDQMTTSNIFQNDWNLYAQYWQETTYVTESNYNIVPDNIPNDVWNWMYQDVLINLQQATKTITATAYPTDPSPTIKQNKLAIVDILDVHVWSTLVETFGNVPYSQALNINNVNPVYDDGKTIYENLVTRLNTDIATLEANLVTYPAGYGFRTADNVYGSNAEGDVTCWIKYANSLRLKMCMNLADCDNTFSTKWGSAAVTDGNFIQSNSENCTLPYLSTPPYTNPRYEDQIASGRHDFVAAITIIDTMTNWSDPREPFYFTTVDTSTVTPPSAVYIGATVGAQCNYYTTSNIAPSQWLPTCPGIVFEASQVYFLLAEAASRGGYGVSGTAQSYYNQGVTASIENWGGTAAQAATYLAEPQVAFNSAQWKESIGLQQWIAFFNRGFDEWTELRRLQYPVLTTPPSAAPGGFPNRFSYPSEEQTLNAANWAAASAAIGGDYVNTVLFFWPGSPYEKTRNNNNRGK